MTSQSDAWNANGDAPDWEALARYLAGESPSGEASRVQRWLDGRPADREAFEAIQAASGAMPAPDVDVEAALARTRERMRQPARSAAVASHAGAARAVTAASAATAVTAVTRMRWVGAIVTLAAAAGIVATVTRVTRSAAPAAGAGAARTYATAVGQRDAIRLADGTRVILGPASQLSVQAGYGGTARAVQLRGDAYFEVRHDPRAPFRVRVDDALIQDIGTAFTVESDVAGGATVAVLAGSVRLGAPDAPAARTVVLRAGDRGALDTTGAARVTPGGASGADTAWTSGRLVFANASLIRVAGELRRWYGVDLVVGDSTLRDRHLTATFAGEPADEVLRTIAVTLGARLEQHGDTAVMTAAPQAATTR